MRTVLSSRSSICVALISSLSTAVLLAAPAAADDTPPMDAVLRRLDQLEQRNAALEGEVKTLREAEGAAWLTEQRAAQIREVVTDTLADANSRASLQSNGMTAGWDDGFFLSSPDGRFKLEVGGMVQFRYILGSMRKAPFDGGIQALDWREGVKTRSGFDSGNSQIWLGGHLFGPGLTYKLRGRFTNDEAVAIQANPTRALETGSGILTLEDAWARFELEANWFVRAGQFRLPFARETLVESQYQMAVDRSIVEKSLSTGYSQGLELGYASDYVRFQVAFSDGGNDQVAGRAKLAGANPINRPWTMNSADWALTGRVEFKPFGEWSDFNDFTSPPGSDFGMLFGFATHWQSARPDYGGLSLTLPVNRGDNQWLMMTADATIDFGGASLFGAFTWSNTDSESAIYDTAFTTTPQGATDLGAANKWGLVMQGAFYVMPKVELYARWELGQMEYANPDLIGFPNINNPFVVASILGRENHLNVISTGFNWYLDGHDVKITGDVGYSLDSLEPSWYAPDRGWRVSDVRDQWVARLQLQVVF